MSGPATDGHFHDGRPHLDWQNHGGHALHQHHLDGRTEWWSARGSRVFTVGDLIDALSAVDRDIPLDSRVEDSIRSDHPWFGRNVPVTGVQVSEAGLPTIVVTV